MYSSCEPSERIGVKVDKILRIRHFSDPCTEHQMMCLPLIRIQVGVTSSNTFWCGVAQQGSYRSYINYVV